MIEAVIFDCDGVILDSEPLWDKADIILLGKRGFQTSPELFLKRLGTGQEGTMEIYKKEFGIDEEVKSLVGERSEIFNGLLQNDIGKIGLIDGTKELLSFLKQQDKILAIATGGYIQEELAVILKAHEISGYFTVLTTREEVVKGKPDPEIYELTGKRMGLDSKKCLVIEDAPNGVIAGKSAGMEVFGVHRDDTTRGKLEEAGADRVFKSLFQIKEYFSQYNSY